MTFESLQANEALFQVDGDIGVFSNGTSHGVPLECQGETGLRLMCNGKVGIPLQTMQVIGPSSRDEEVNPGLFLSCLKGVKYPFEAQEGRWDISRNAAVERVLIPY